MSELSQPQGPVDPTSSQGIPVDAAQVEGLSVHPDISPAASELQATPERIEGSKSFTVDSLEPIVDPDHFHETTGLFGNLIVKIQVGNSLLGVIDRKSFLRSKNLPENVQVIWGSADGNHALAKKDAIHAVILTPSGEVRRDAGGRPLLFPLKSEQTMIVGRADDNDICLSNDLGVSKRHANIVFDEKTGAITITDRDSTNGTFVETKSTDASPQADTPHDQNGEWWRQQGDGVASGGEWWDDAVTAAGQVVGTSGQALSARIEQQLNPENVGRQFQVAVAERVDPRHPERMEDTSLVDEAHGIFGVFDGAGGHKKGDQASRTASHAISEVLRGIPAVAQQEEVELAIRQAFDAAHRAVKEKVPGGITTGVVAKTFTDGTGNDFVAWASVGDSRLYVFNRETQELRQVSEDETLQQNALKSFAERGEAPPPNNFEHLAHVISNAFGESEGEDAYHFSQSGTFQLTPQEQIILCSDGIVGDNGTDVLSAEEIRSALSSATSSEQAAQELLRISRKTDDKAVVVAG